ncbi:TonB-dependent receptor [candidate division KSB1 bacterium]|nr:TonB-dependent receptor [candidate division KSB1 bacterium]
MKKITLLLSLILLLLSINLFAGVTGKIVGIVTDANNGEPLAGANILIEGTIMGAAASLDGYYVILNVPPGTYTLKATMMGYTTYSVSEVRVKIDQTTTIDFKMKQEVISGEMVEVTAVRPIVEKDVSASQLNISSQHIEALPVASVTEVVGLQAGVTSSMSIRGSGSDQSIFMVDGIILRDERNNQPITAVPLSAVQEVSVQTGGFSAEYNNVRSGVVNVVTKEGDRERYGGRATIKYHPPTQKHFGISPYDPDAFWLRPYLDPEVCWTGTENGAWDYYQQRQYPKFEGWNAVAERTLNDDDPTNDLTPAAAQRIFEWEHRKQGDIDKPDYNIDAGFGGPLPFVSDLLGNLRFYTSFRREQDMYLMELSREALTNQSGMLKLTSDLSETMKLSVTSLYGEIYASALSRSGGTSYMSSSWGIANAVDRSGFTVPWRIFTNTYWSPTARYYNIFSAKFTHLVSPTLFYELQLKRSGKKYHTAPGKTRDFTKSYELFDGYWVDEAPIGFEADARFGIDGLGMGGPVSTSRDYSKFASTSAKFDLVSQVNRNNEIKAGFEFVYDQLDMDFGMVNKFLPEGNTWTKFEQSPYRLTTYLQDKLEYKGFISTIGFIMEYSNPNGDWYDIDIYNREFFSDKYSDENEGDINKKKAKAQLNISPRLGVSHPITENSKLYFNYGHYRQMPTSERLYRVQRAINNKIDYLGDPTIPLARTVAYELGYDHALFENYLFHLAAYYKDITDQEDWTRFISIDGKVNYYKLTTNNYQDIRGFEIDLTKTTGRWFFGNINYEYRVGTSGYFGLKQYNENPADQREYLRQNPKQSKPRPIPRFKAYVDFHTPRDFGPAFSGFQPLSEWHLNFIGRWTAGSWGTWNPNAIPGIQYNVQWKSYYNVDIKLSKTIAVGKFDFQLFMDIYNLFNFKHFSGVSFHDSHDYNFYMKSLHLPADIGDELTYGNIPGSDGPGDVRNQGVEYVPMEWTATIEKIGDPKARAIYYAADTKKYMQYSENEWTEVSKSRVNQVLDDKAYIDMPNQTYFTFLNPRSVFFGLTLSYNF